MSFLFGSSSSGSGGGGGGSGDLKERSKAWQTSLKKEARTLERERQKLEREELKIKQELKKTVKSGQTKAAAILARSVLRSRNQRNKMLEQITKINSAVLTIKSNMATQKVVGTMAKSSQIMAAMSKLISIPQMASIAKSLSKEMMKAGIIEEMVDDAISATDNADLEVEADAEVDAVIKEITDGEFDSVASITNNLEAHKNKSDTVKNKSKQEEIVNDKEFDEMKERLQKLGAS